MTDLTIRVEQTPAVTVVHVAGDASMLQVAHLESALNPVVAAHPERVVVDLTGLTMIGSLAMGAIVMFKRALARNGGTLFVAAPNPLVLEALARTRLTELLNVHASVADAMAVAAAGL